MYPVSDAFHNAVRNGNKQKAMLIFDDAVFTDSDINIDRGITFNDRFNMKDSLSIGQTPSNEISFSLFNDRRYLNSYGFGDFLATIGVKIGESEFYTQGNVFLRTLHDYAGYSTYPYLTRDGAGLNVAPGFPVSALLGYNGLVWAFSALGDYAVYQDWDGTNVTGMYPMNTFMRDKVKGWGGKGYYYNRDSRVLFIYDTERKMREYYEFCPLGKFIAERPNAPDRIAIDMVCYDLMQRFDIDMPTPEEMQIVYPTSVGWLFTRMCNYVNLPFRANWFYNSEIILESEPEDFRNSTMRTVLGWIAEAAGSNARIDRDGYVVLDWVRNTNQRYSEGDYTSYEPYWYAAKPVDKLYVRDTTDYGEQIVGNGSEGYLIQDNPLLSGAG